jgi:hypothetical protein
MRWNACAAAKYIEFHGKSFTPRINEITIFYEDFNLHKSQNIRAKGKNIKEAKATKDLVKIRRY